MMEKIAGNNCIDSFNLNNKWLERAIMAQAKMQQLMADKQYGSHKSWSAIIQCLNKHLWYDYLRGTRIQQLFAPMMQRVVTIVLSS